MRLRELLPWRDFIIETAWPPDVAGIELRKRLDKPSFLGASGDAPFVGESTDGVRFSFRRAISYRNSFLPRIVARIEPSHHHGARIHVSMRLNGFVMVFMTVWLTFATFGGLAGGLATLAHGQPAGLFGLLFPLFGVALTTLPFAFEARKAERLLHEIYGAAPALPAPPDTGKAYR